MNQEVIETVYLTFCTGVINYMVHKVSPIISTFLLLLTIISITLFVFSLMLIYHYTSLGIKKREKQYGILMALGMNEKEIFVASQVYSLYTGIISSILTITMISICFSLFRTKINSFTVLDVSILNNNPLIQLSIFLGSLLVSFMGSFLPAMRIGKTAPVKIIHRSR